MAAYSSLQICFQNVLHYFILWCDYTCFYFMDVELFLNWLSFAPILWPLPKKVYRHYKVSYLSSLFTLSLPRPSLTIFLKVFALQLCFTSLEGNSPFCAYIGPQWRRRVLHAKSVISAVVFLLIFRFERHPKKVNENKWRKMGRQDQATNSFCGTSCLNDKRMLQRWRI